MKKFVVYGSRTGQESQREKRNRKLARRAAADGMVLLKNDGILPLKPGPVTIYGSGARMTVRGGTGSGDMNERRSVSLEEGLLQAGYTIKNIKGMDRFDNHYEEENKKWRAGIEKNIKKYKPWQIMPMFDYIHENGFRFPNELKIQPDEIDSSSDTAIYVIARQAGEGHDRHVKKGDYLLDDTEMYNIDLLVNTYKHIILVINCGGVIDLSVLDRYPSIGATIYIGQAGTEGGNAFADVLSGKVAPSGKLTETWAMKYEDYPNADTYSYRNGNLEQEDYLEDIYVGYRYFDSFGVKPRFPFGYGLTYTNFTITAKDFRLENERIIMQVEVLNNGDIYSGREVVQLYLEKPQKEIAQEKKSLCAYAKTGVIDPGKKETVRLEFYLRDVTSFDEEKASYILYKGEYGILIGNSSDSTLAVGVLDVTQNIISEKVDHVCPLHSQFTRIQSELLQNSYSEELKRIVITPDCMETITHNYSKPSPKMSKKTSEIMKKLTKEDMATLCVGASMMGKVFLNTPGCVGRTASTLLEKGIPNVNFCDGPAGLRVQKGAVFSKKGTGFYMNELPSDISWGIIRKTARFTTKRPDQGLPVYQYMTAWPASSLQAQTWDIELLKSIGDAVGTEMEEIGCTLWLAPALNIRRNPLCGRNFEYYSEDPLISGTMATAISGGVQNHAGVGVVAKHFACNNQEDNRNHVSENVTERALREIYLRGFSMVVKRAKPWAMMTSYNKINDVYTANSYGLLTKVLKNEWGFDGLVMTDWGAAGGDCADYGACPASGNDLIMPGDDAAKKGLLDAIEQGKLLEEDLRNSAIRVMNMIFESKVVKEL